MIPETIVLKVKRKKNAGHAYASITLTGAWLEKAGFLSNDSAAVAIYHNTLIIRPVKKDTEC